MNNLFDNPWVRVGASILAASSPGVSNAQALGKGLLLSGQLERQSKKDKREEEEAEATRKYRAAQARKFLMEADAQSQFQGKSMAAALRLAGYYGVGDPTTEQTDISVNVIQPMLAAGKFQQAISYSNQMRGAFKDQSQRDAMSRLDQMRYGGGMPAGGSEMVPVVGADGGVTYQHVPIEQAMSAQQTGYAPNPYVPSDTQSGKDYAMQRIQELTKRRQHIMSNVPAYRAANVDVDSELGKIDDDLRGWWTRAQAKDVAAAGAPKIEVMTGKEAEKEARYDVVSQNLQELDDLLRSGDVDLAGLVGLWKEYSTRPEAMAQIANFAAGQIENLTGFKLKPTAKEARALSIFNKIRVELLHAMRGVNVSAKEEWQYIKNLPVPGQSEETLRANMDVTMENIAMLRRRKRELTGQPVGGGGSSATYPQEVLRLKPDDPPMELDGYMWRVLPTGEIQRRKVEY